MYTPAETDCNSNDKISKKAYTIACFNREDGVKALAKKSKSPVERRPRAVNTIRLDCHSFTVQGPTSEIANILLNLTKESLARWHCGWCGHRLAHKDDGNREFPIGGREAVCEQFMVRNFNPEYSEDSVAAAAQSCVVM